MNRDEERHAVAKRVVPHRPGWALNPNRQERHDTDITARQQRRRRLGIELTSKIQMRRYKRLMARLFASGPGCQVRDFDPQCVVPLNRRDWRFMDNYVDALNSAQEVR